MAPNVMTLHIMTIVMHVCMVSYMIIDYMHANHACKVKFTLLGLMYVLKLLYVIRYFRVMACFVFQLC
jgi:hypothetical protein